MEPSERTHSLAVGGCRRSFGLRSRASCRFRCCLRLRQQAPEGAVKLGVLVQVRLVVFDSEHLHAAVAAVNNLVCSAASQAAAAWGIQFWF